MELPTYHENTLSQESTKVFFGDEAVTKLCTQVLCESKLKCEYCLDSNSPSVTLKFYRNAIKDAIARGVTFRILTEITPVNLSYCKELIKMGIELRHLDKIKVNFTIFDSKIHLASDIVREAETEPVSQIVYSNVRTIIEQQQYFFQTLWNMAITAEQKIKEIEDGIPTERTEVLDTPENTSGAVVEFLSGISNSIDICANRTWPSLAIGGEIFKDELFKLAKRGIKSKFVTEITKDNIHYCKQVMKLGELRHLEGIKGNLAVSEREYIAFATLQKDKSLQQIIRSNVKEIVEQQRYIFESFWNRAIPADIRIREIEQEIVLGNTQILQVPSRIEELFIDLVRSARRDVMLMLPTVNAFFREEHIGVMEMLEEAALERGVEVRVLTPVNQRITETIKNMIAKDRLKKLEIRPIDSLDPITLTTVTIIIIDKQKSLAIEKTDDSKENFVEAIGYATYSNSSPTVMSYLSVFESLWNQTQLYARLKEANEELLATEIAKEEFISMVNHELKTPIELLKGYTQMLLRPKIMGEVNQLQKNAIEVMRRNIDKLQALVNDVLDVYKLDLRKLKFSMTDTDISKLVNETIAEIKPLALDKKVDIQADVRINRTVFCDPSRICQVLSNLIKNSIEFVPGNGAGKVVIRIEKVGEYNNNTSEKMILFTVEDNGIGIDQTKADKLFQKFYQIDTGYTRKHAGTGLGLSICKGIIDAHVGEIWLDRTYRSGTAIKFTLPAGRNAGISGTCEYC